MLLLLFLRTGEWTTETEPPDPWTGESVPVTVWTIEPTPANVLS